ncbi:MAG: hypothetical protein AABW80_00905 [Nanoarchaeota archaeon]
MSLRVNLANHFAIGFHEEWRRRQGLLGKNLLKLFYKDCLRQGVDIVGVASEEAKPIIRGSVDDRFGWLIRHCVPELTRDGEYSFLEIDGNTFGLFKRGEGAVTFVNAQTIQAKYPDVRGTTMKVLVFGGYYFENGLPLKETLKRIALDRCLVIAENQFSEGIHSLEARAIRELVSLYDAMVVHDAQQGKKTNEYAKSLSQEISLPGVAIGNQHSPSRCKAGIIVPERSAIRNSTSDLVISLRDILGKKAHDIDSSYENPFTKLRWGFSIQIGH